MILFFGVAYAWGWIVYTAMVVFHATPEWTILATLGPTVAALVAHRVTAGNYRAFRLASTWMRTLGATLVGVALMVLAFVVLPAAATTDPRQLRWGALISISVYNYSTLLGGPLFEEPGWRGFALPRLEARFGPVLGSILLALLWAGWHLPLFWYPGWTTAPAWVYVLIVLGATVLLTYGTNVARFGVITPIAMHAAFNTVGKFLNGLFKGTDGPRVDLPFELVMALSGLAVAVVLILVTQGRLGYAQDPGLDAMAHRVAVRRFAP
jgi:membrane protease YdiL (CAAX protease family)